MINTGCRNTAKERGNKSKKAYAANHRILVIRLKKIKRWVVALAQQDDKPAGKETAPGYAGYCSLKQSGGRY